jgi:hypothetical protein
MDLREVGWGGIDWINLTQRPMKSSCEHGNELSGSIKCWDITWVIEQMVGYQERLSFTGTVRCNLS